MRYLFSVAPDHTSEDFKDTWAPPGEPVVPWYPATLENVFLSTVSFKRVPTARVISDSTVDIDKIADRLKKNYPGLPGSIHEAYVLAIAKAAYEYPVGTQFQIFITKQEAKLKVVGKEDYKLLWDKQPGI